MQRCLFQCFNYEQIMLPYCFLFFSHYFTKNQSLQKWTSSFPRIQLQSTSTRRECMVAHKHPPMHLRNLQHSKSFAKARQSESTEREERNLNFSEHAVGITRCEDRVFAHFHCSNLSLWKMWINKKDTEAVQGMTEGFRRWLLLDHFGFTMHLIVWELIWHCHPCNPFLHHFLRFAIGLFCQFCRTSINVLMGEYIIAIDVTRVRFPADERHVHVFSCWFSKNFSESVWLRIKRLGAFCPRVVEETGFAGAPWGYLSATPLERSPETLLSKTPVASGFVKHCLWYDTTSATLSASLLGLMDKASDF